MKYIESDIISQERPHCVLKGNLDKAEEELETCKENKERLEHELTEYENNFYILSNKKEKLNNELEKSKQDLANLLENRNNAKNKFEKYDVKCKELFNEKEILEAEIAKLKNTNEVEIPKTDDNYAEIVQTQKIEAEEQPNI